MLARLLVVLLVERVEDLNLLTLGTHPLKGNRKGEWGMNRDEELENYLQI